MSIVGRGLGRRAAAAALLVTAGLGLSQAPTPPTPDETSALRGGPDGPRRRTDFSDDDLFQIAIAIIVSGALDG